MVLFFLCYRTVTSSCISKILDERIKSGIRKYLCIKYVFLKFNVKMAIRQLLFGCKLP